MICRSSVYRDAVVKSMLEQFGLTFIKIFIGFRQIRYNIKISNIFQMGLFILYQSSYYFQSIICRTLGLFLELGLQQYQKTSGPD